MTTVARYGSSTSALPIASITIMVSTAPAPKPPSSSENGRPSRPCSASLPQTVLLQPPFSRAVFLARVEVVGIVQETVDAFLEKPLLLGQIKIHVVYSLQVIA